MPPCRYEVSFVPILEGVDLEAEIQSLEATLAAVERIRTNIRRRRWGGEDEEEGELEEVWD